MRCFLVSHTHWDREWYRTFQDFRGRLVDAVDRLLELCEADPGYHFLLDGQSIVLEDYLAIRPHRRADLERLCRAGRIAVGPWYVQPDSLLPSGESHVRNLLEGLRVAAALGRASRVAYTPDSFGHPAQFPQLLAGFGLEGFVYWRGHGSEEDALPTEYWWTSPDGSTVLASHLSRGYFNAATGPGSDPERAARRIAKTLREQVRRAESGSLLLMNGIDHALPEPRTALLAEAIAKETGWKVRRGLIEDFLEAVRETPPDPAVGHRGELVGGRSANLLPGVWSARTWIKIRNRACEAWLEAWAEPWCALALRLGVPDERAALREAWRTLLPNHAHDSLCGCSRDEVHDQMAPRFDAAEELARVTTRRVLERVAGLDTGRSTPWTAEPALAVFNPSPHPRTDVVRFAVDPHPWMAPSDGADVVEGIHPLTLRCLDLPGFEADGVPVRLAAGETGRLALVPDREGPDLEFVVRDVPALGWKCVPLRVTEVPDEEVDEGREIRAGGVAVRAGDDGTLDVSFGDRTFRGLAALLDLGDRGDTYDADLVDAVDAAAEGVRLASVRVERRRHAGGLQHLAVRRVLDVPAALAPDRETRSAERARIEVDVEARVAPGVGRVDLHVTVRNEARDHRLQILFPTGAPAPRFHAATTFDVAERAPGPLSEARAAGWIHPAPATYPCQGWAHAGGLTVVAPGLAEGEALSDGTLAFTLLRAVGYLSRHDLRSRPGPAGPGTETPGAQCLGAVEARLSLLPGLDPRAARDAETGLQAVTAGPAPRAQAGRALLALEPRELLLSALKPAEPDAAAPGDGALVVRVLNPTDRALEATLRPGFAFARAAPVRLDETPVDLPLVRDGDVLRFSVPPHALRSLRIE